MVHMLTSGAQFDDLLVFGIYIHEESGVKVIMSIIYRSMLHLEQTDIFGQTFIL